MDIEGRLYIYTVTIVLIFSAMYMSWTGTFSWRDFGWWAVWIMLFSAFITPLAADLAFHRWKK